MAREPEVVLGLMRAEVVEDDVDFLAGVLGDYLIHEGKEFDPAPTLRVPAVDGTG